MKAIIVVFTFLALTCKAQDTLHLVNDTKKPVKILTVATAHITYYNWPVAANPILFTLETEQIKYAKLQDGTLLNFQDNQGEKVDYFGKRKNAIKLNLFAPLFFNSTSVCYERSTKPGQSLEIEIGFIGRGLDPYGDNARGMIYKVGYKFIKVPRRKKSAHFLAGAYVRPQFVYSSYTIDKYTGGGLFSASPERLVKEKHTASAFLAEFGWQAIGKDRFLFDAYVGAGIGGGSETVRRFGFAGFIFVGVSAGVRLGLLF
jgi:hypothetical protein